MINRRQALQRIGTLAGAAFAAPTAATAATQQTMPLPSPAPRAPGFQAVLHPRFELGADRFIAQAWQGLAGRRVGLVTNQTGVLSSGKTLLSEMVRNPAIDVRALYSPEHGLHGDHSAGSHVGSSIDPRTQLPIYSLYGKTKQPTAAMLTDVDVLLFDIQDVGARTYTYISTLALVMQAAAAQQKSVWVLDRPNPIGGTIVEGPVLEPAFASFIGLYPMPMRHGMTIGEIATLYQQSFGIACDLEVVRMQGYDRTMLWPQTRLPWIPTSPNIPHFLTALVYLTTGPLGAAGIVNGVGSNLPFEIALAPGLDGIGLAEKLNASGLPGVHFQPWFWIPQSGYWRDQRLDGIRLKITQPRTFLSVRTGVEILTAIRQLSPQHLRFATGFDRDWGTATLRNGLIQGLSSTVMERRWQTSLQAFATPRQRSLLYS